MDEEEGVSVILVTGFLESGKTTFLRDAVTQEYFQIEDRTLLINCESGEEEYDPAMLAKYRTDYTEIDSEENFTPETLAELDRRFKPGRVLIEYNPLWGMQRFEEMKLPEDWEIIQQIGLVDSTTYVVYRTNMKSLFTEMAKYCELFIFNRASKDMPLADFRRGIKAANPSCDVVFEDKDGEQIDIFEDRPPYDVTAPVIDIDDADFGIFYIDLGDHRERYDGKTVRFHAQIGKSKRRRGRTRMVGRRAMTCCAADIQFLALPCRDGNIWDFGDGDWVNVTAKVRWVFSKVFKEEEPEFIVQAAEKAEAPAEELVVFS
ncbi:MAG: GTPase [Lachnospiraceae bacterium]|jgi:hypothetical protein|nr:GTPase [Lachnospiraceae bacterium]MCH4064325.1 GTPase [Lachnospiraceae bacterium]MCH4102950.1 GTPase [Lachnospiraceae bacterium]MCI1308939.1 GTPase [Lachnospiraceae bacterium]MCI1333431.1 GTPase [Lachnospiraceae bacterium]